MSPKTPRSSHAGVGPEVATSRPGNRAFTSIREWLESNDRLGKSATEAIDDQVLPAYKKLDRYFNQKYLPAAMGEGAVMFTGFIWIIALFLYFYAQAMAKRRVLT